MSLLLGLFALLLESLLRRLDLLDLVDEAVLDLVADQVDARSVGAILEASVRQLEHRVLVANGPLQVVDVLLQAGDFALRLFCRFVN